MRTFSGAGHVYDIDLEQVGSCVFIVFLSVRLERIRLNDPLVKVQVRLDELVDLKLRIDGMGFLGQPDPYWRLGSLCGIPVEVIGEASVPPALD